MRNCFPEYYRPTNEELAEKFKECIFCFDTNALLNLYRFTNDSRENLIHVLTFLKDRIWLPHQVGLEYQRGRINVLLGELDMCDGLITIIDSAIKSINSLRRTKSFTVTTLIDPIKADLECIKVNLKDKKFKKPDLMTGDPVFEAVSKLFDGKVGAPFTTEYYKEVYKQGKERYDNDIPPGFMDKNTKNPTDVAQYGDLILWHQLLQFAKNETRPIILVTDDAKVDWWREVKGEKLGPRTELIQEFMNQTGGTKWFYMYSTEQFLKYAKEFLDVGVTSQAIKEAKGIEQQDTVQEMIRVNIASIQAAKVDLLRGDLTTSETKVQTKPPEFASAGDKMSIQYNDARKMLGSNRIPFGDARGLFASMVVAKAQAKADAEAWAEEQAQAEADAEAWADEQAWAEEQAEAEAQAEAQAEADAEAWAEEQAQAEADADAEAWAEEQE